MTLDQKLFERVRDSGFFEMIDVHLGRLISDFHHENPAELFLAAAILCKSARDGHTCLSIDVMDKILGELRAWMEKKAKEAGAPGVSLPSRISLDTLKSSPAVGLACGDRPIVIGRNGLLYLQRYWHYEERIADTINTLKGDRAERLNMQDMKSSIDRLFPRNGASLQPDWQKAAAITALLGGLTVITGGPGTGKTTTVARILALMLEQDSRMKIAVAAPTGKAAGRIKESIKREKESLNVSEEVREKIPLSTSTIHRLLGPSVNSPNFRHNREYPLAADLVVVDEASMVDLPLMAKLLDAMKRDARLILLGDRNQLASVETGSVFGDICTPRNVDSFSSGFASRLSSLSGETFPAQVKQGGWLTDSVIELKKNYRFGEDTSIGRLSREIVRGCGDGVMELLRDCRNSTGGQVTWRELPGRQDFPNALKKRVGGYFSEYAGTRDVSEAFQKLAAFRLLSPLRSGWWGIEQINMIIEKLILAEYREPSFPRTYPRKPLLVTANDYNLMLFNGDLGIVFADGSGPLRVFFESDRDEGDRFRSFSPGRLPPYEPAYAMTVHKSQGSEFDELLLVLPPEDSPILTLEILYTAVTRARKRVEIWGSEEVIRKCVGRRIERISGIGTNT